MKQTGLRIVIILLGAGLIAGGLYLFSTTPAAESIAAAGGHHAPPPGLMRGEGTNEGGLYQRGDRGRLREHSAEHAAAGPQQPPGHTEGGSLLSALPGIIEHIVLVALMIAVVALLGKGISAWNNRRKRNAASVGT